MWELQASATVTLIAMGSVQSAVALSCSDIPVGAVCTFSPASVTPRSHAVSSSLMISTTAIAAVGTVPVGGWQPEYGLFLSSSGVAGMAVSGSWLNRKRICQWLAIGGLLSSCGGGAAPVQRACALTTSTGTFTVTINGGAGSPHSSTVIALTIQ